MPQSKKLVARCPKCELGDLQKLPPNQISRNPGFFCPHCDTKLRDSNSTLILAGIVLLGSMMAVAGLFITLVGLPEKVATGRRGPIFLLIAGAVVSFWAARQLFVPKAVK